MNTEYEYTRKNLMELYEKSSETIRQWTLEFKEFLSSSANPSSGSRRWYTQDDLKVFSLIHNLRKRGSSYEDIRLALIGGDRGVVPDEAVELAVPMQDKHALTVVQLKIVGLENEIDELQELLAMERRKSHDLEVKMNTIALETRLEEMQNRMDLEREIGRLQAKIEMLQEKDD